MPIEAPTERENCTDAAADPRKRGPATVCTVICTVGIAVPVHSEPMASMPVTTGVDKCGAKAASDSSMMELTASPMDGRIAVRPVAAMMRPVNSDPVATPNVSGNSRKPEWAVVAPRTTCRYIGRNATSDTVCAATQAASVSVRQIPAWRNSWIGSSGEDARFSCRISRASDAIATASSPSTDGSDASSNRWARSIASSTGAMKPAKNTVPRTSKRADPPRTGWAGSRMTRNAASRPSGRFTRNTECQPYACVSQPPATGPNVAADAYIPDK